MRDEADWVWAKQDVVLLCQVAVFGASSLIDLYGKCGVVWYAQKLFDEMPQRNVVTWNNLIFEYFQAGAPEVDVRRTIDGQVKRTPKLMDESYEEDEDEHSETLCGSCGGNYNADEFWIGCDICERWYHGKCVKITPAKAESIKQYKCPSCIKRNQQ
ncbi:hypothetical protein QQ045_011352 [Rhodiola kirilowii]